MAEPVIVELAVNGATPRHRNRHVPRTPAEITEAALAGIGAGGPRGGNHKQHTGLPAAAGGGGGGGPRTGQKQKGGQMYPADGLLVAEPYLAAWRPVLERHPDALLY